MKTWSDIVDSFDIIKSVEAKGKNVVVNGQVVATYKFELVAKAVAQKVSYFKVA